MCLILEITKPSKHAERIIRSAAKRNPDGYGLAYYTDDWHGVKGLHRGRAAPILKAYHAVKQYAAPDHPIVLHVRQATAGEVSLKNCHPFRLGGALFFHNGHFSIPNFFLADGDSDSAHVARMLAAYVLKRDKLDTSKLDKALDGITGSRNKVLICLPNGHTRKYGQFNYVEPSLCVSNFYAWNSWPYTTVAKGSYYDTQAGKQKLDLGYSTNAPYSYPPAYYKI